MPETLHGIAELPTYIRLAKKLLSLEERQDLINYLAEHPKSGDVIEGTAAFDLWTIASKSERKEEMRELAGAHLPG